MSYTSNSTSICTVSGASVTLVTVGVCSITANQTGNASFAAASPVTRTFNINNPLPTLTSISPTSATAGGGAFNLTLTGTNFINASFVRFNGTAIATVFSSSTQLTATVPANLITTFGTFLVIASNPLPGGGDSASRNFNVTQSAQTITFPQPADMAVNAGPVNLTATASSLLTVSYTSNSTSICTVTGASVTLLTVGVCSITANQVGNATYSPAPAITKTFNLALATQTAFTAIATPASVAIGATSALSTTGGSGSGAISFTSNNANCTILGNTLTAALVGGCTVTATKAADSNFNSTTATVAVTTTPATQTVTFTPASPVSVGVAPITLTAVASSGLTTFTFSTSSASTICTVAGNQLTIGGSGTCALIATQAGNANFANASANADVIVEVLFTAVQSRKTHGAAGDFDIAIDTTLIAPNITVEPRTIGAGHSIVFQFNGAVSAAGTVSVAPVGNAMAVAVGNDVVVTLTSVSDNQRVTVTLLNVNGSVNPPPAAIGFMVGDVNNTRSVNSSDISGVKARSGQATTALNFRFDVNATGAINSSDISAVKARSGLTLP